MGYLDDAGSPKVHNSPKAHAAKVAIRRKVLEAIEKPVVFDAFAGHGEMFTAVWSAAAGYVGCDEKWMRDGRTMFCCDNKRVLRAIDLVPFNIFDLDAYGTPWEQALIIADRRRVSPGQRIGLVLTEGNGFGLKMGGLPTAIRVLTGVKPGIVGLWRKQDDLINRSIAGLAKRMRCTIEKRWQAEGTTGVAMRYIGLVLRGVD